MNMFEFSKFNGYFQLENWLHQIILPSNTFITSGGNLDLGINIINWLAGDDQLITIQPMPLKDINVSSPNDSKSVFIAWF